MVLIFAMATMNIAFWESYERREIYQSKVLAVMGISESNSKRPEPKIQIYRLQFDVQRIGNLKTKLQTFWKTTLNWTLTDQLEVIGLLKTYQSNIETVSFSNNHCYQTEPFSTVYQNLFSFSFFFTYFACFVTEHGSSFAHKLQSKWSDNSHIC